MKSVGAQGIYYDLKSKRNQHTAVHTRDGTFNLSGVISTAKTDENPTRASWSLKFSGNLLNHQWALFSTKNKLNSEC